MGYGAQHRPPTHGTMYLVAAVVAQPCTDLRRLKDLLAEKVSLVLFDQCAS